MNIVMILLRVTHVLAGVFWAGATFVLASHVTPSVKAAGDAGKVFMQQLSGKSNISNILGLTGTLTLVSGLVMYSLQGWDKQLMTPSGIALAAGAVLGAGAYFHGLFVQRKTITLMQKTGAEIAAAGGPPSPEQAAQMQTYSDKIERNGQILSYMLALTVVLMGVFQYL